MKLVEKCCGARGHKWPQNTENTRCMLDKQDYTHVNPHVHAPGHIRTRTHRHMCNASCFTLYVHCPSSVCTCIAYAFLSATNPGRPWFPPCLCFNGHRVSFPGVMGSERDIHIDLHLAPRLRIIGAMYLSALYLYGMRGTALPLLLLTLSSPLHMLLFGVNVLLSIVFSCAYNSCPEVWRNMRRVVWQFACVNCLIIRCDGYSVLAVVSWCLIIRCKFGVRSNTYTKS
jgi:hypothetical protein